MKTYSNADGITRMKFTAPVTALCPLGPNYYRATVICEVELDKTIVDFNDLEHYFKKDLNGKKLTTENLCNAVFQLFKEIYNPKHLKITVLSDSHFPIETIKEDGFVSERNAYGD